MVLMALMFISLILQIKGDFRWCIVWLWEPTFLFIWRCQVNRRANFLFTVSSGTFAVGLEWWKPLYCCAGRSHNPERNTVFSLPTLLACLTIPHFRRHAAVLNDSMAGNRYGGSWRAARRPLSPNSWCLSGGTRVRSRTLLLLSPPACRNPNNYRPADVGRCSYLQPVVWIIEREEGS